MIALMCRARLAATALLVTFGLTACGGHKAGGYTLSATRSCLEQAGFQTAVVTNVYLPASGGDLRVRLAKSGKALLNPQQPKGGIAPDDFVFLVFAKDNVAALATEKKALRLAIQSLRVRGFQTSPAAVKKDVGLADNVFYYSATGGVSASDRGKLTACLK
jgi:hypothetical protein